MTDDADRSNPRATTDSDESDRTGDEGSADQSPPSDEPANDTAASDIPNPRDGLTDPSENVPAPEAPTVTAPEVGVDVPEAPSPDEIPEGLRAEFWELVIAFNVAVFGLALGAMLVVFNGDVALGGLATGIGVLALGYGLYQFRTREHTP